MHVLWKMSYENVISEILKEELTKKLYCTRLCNKGAHSFCVAACFEYAQIAQQKNLLSTPSNNDW